MREQVTSDARHGAVSLVVTVLLSAAGYPAEPRIPAARSRAANRPTAPTRPTRPSPQTSTEPTPLRSPASFTPQMTFGEAVEILRNCTRPPLNIVVLWRDIEENAGVFRDTPIGLDGLPGLRVRQYIEMLVASMSAGSLARIDYVVHGGIITIATKERLPTPKLETRVYDVRDLVAPPAQYSLGTMGFGGIGYGGQMTGAGSYGGGFGMGFGSGAVGGGGYGFGGGGLTGFTGNLFGGVGGRSLPYGR